MLDFVHTCSELEQADGQGPPLSRASRRALTRSGASRSDTMVVGTEKRLRVSCGCSHEDALQILKRAMTDGPDEQPPTE